MTLMDPEAHSLEEWVEHQNRALALAHIGTWEWDVDRDRTVWSAGLYRIFGVDPRAHRANLEGFLERVHPDDRDRVATLVARSVETHTPLEYETRIVRPNGETRFVDARGEPILDPDHGRLLRFMGTIQDITTRRVLEDRVRKAERMASIGALAGGIAHEFNNLLVSIEGHVAFLRNDLPDVSQYRDDLDGIARAARNAAGLVDRLLAFSGKQLKPLRPVELTAAVRDMEPMLHRLVDGRAVLVLDLADGLGPAMVASGQVEQVLLTLVENACEAMPEGGVIRIRTDATTAAPDEQDTLPLAEPSSVFTRLTVENTGVGIRADTHERIFDPFSLPEAVSDRTRLGLAAAHGIARRSGGHIELESTPGEGSRFSLYLPVATEAPQEPPPYPPPGGAQR